jgi:hypothetical protein
LNRQYEHDFALQERDRFALRYGPSSSDADNLPQDKLFGASFLAGMAEKKSDGKSATLLASSFSPCMVPVSNIAAVQQNWQTLISFAESVNPLQQSSLVRAQIVQRRQKTQIDCSKSHGGAGVFVAKADDTEFTTILPRLTTVKSALVSTVGRVQRHPKQTTDPKGNCSGRRFLRVQLRAKGLGACANQERPLWNEWTIDSPVLTFFLWTAKLEEPCCVLHTHQSVLMLSAEMELLTN